MKNYKWGDLEVDDLKHQLKRITGYSCFGEYHGCRRVCPFFSECKDWRD